MRSAEAIHKHLAARGVVVASVSQLRPGVVAVHPADQQTAAEAALADFDWSDEAERAWEEDRQPVRRDLRRAAAKAVEDIDTYLVIADTATPAQVRGQVKLLSRAVRMLVLRVGQID